MYLLYKLYPLSFSKHFDLQEVAKSSAEPCSRPGLPVGISYGCGTTSGPGKGLWGVTAN